MRISPARLGEEGEGVLATERALGLVTPSVDIVSGHDDLPREGKHKAFKGDGTGWLTIAVMTVNNREFPRFGNDGEI